MYVMSAAEIFR